MVGRGSIWSAHNTIISTKLTTTTPTITFKKGQLSEYNKDNNKGQEDSPKKKQFPKKTVVVMTGGKSNEASSGEDERHKRKRQYIAFII